VALFVAASSHIAYALLAFELPQALRLASGRVFSRMIDLTK
jgi:hypothetical protein